MQLEEEIQATAEIMNEARNLTIAKAHLPPKTTLKEIIINISCKKLKNISSKEVILMQKTECVDQI